MRFAIDCPRCQKALPASAHYCRRCGAAQPSAADVPTAPYPPLAAAAVRTRVRAPASAPTATAARSTRNGPRAKRRREVGNGLAMLLIGILCLPVAVIVGGLFLSAVRQIAEPAAVYDPPRPRAPSVVSPSVPAEPVAAPPPQVVYVVPPEVGSPFPTVPGRPGMPPSVYGGPRGVGPVWPGRYNGPGQPFEPNPAYPWRNYSNSRRYDAMGRPIP